MFFTIKLSLLRSKDPEWFNLYSSQKALFLLTAYPVCFFCFYYISNLKVHHLLIDAWNRLAKHFYLIYLVTAVIALIPNVKTGASVGEDIGSQVKTSLQWIEGSVSAPNILKRPNPEDLSIDSREWRLRPPGATLLPIPFMLIGFSLGTSIKLGLFLCLVVGCLGWLKLFYRFKVCGTVLLLMALMLGLKTGNSILFYTTANILLFAIVPWLIMWSIMLKLFIKDSYSVPKIFISQSVFLLFLGTLVWIKLSGIIVAGTVGACSLFFLFFNYPRKSRTTLVILYIISSIFFWTPFAALEFTNFKLSGKTANAAYVDTDSEIEAPLTGKHWVGSTRSLWLGWSFIAAPGFAFPAKSIAAGLRDLSIQFETVRKWMHEKKINAHVLMAGFVGFIVSLLFYRELVRIWSETDNNHKVIVVSFSTLPFFGLAILSYKFQWNYLLYHAHTYEFWLVLLIPLLCSMARSNRLKYSTVALMGLGVMLPTVSEFSIFWDNLTKSKDAFISETESARGLSKNRFSGAVQCIEEDSRSTQDILFFLPAGDAGDMILRTKMRALTTHFSGDNFPNANPFKTSCELNLYCAYDSSLCSNHAFLDALESKFPQAASHEVIFAEEVTVTKVMLVPKQNG